MVDNPTVNEVMRPKVVTVVGTGDGGLVKGTTAITPSDQPNVVFNVVGPTAAILVRFLHNYITAVVALVTAGMIDKKVLPSTDFFHLLALSAGLALGGSILMILKDLVTIFGKLEEKFPLLTGGV